LYHLPGIYTPHSRVGAIQALPACQVVFSIYFTVEVSIRYMSYQSTWKLDDECSGIGKLVGNTQRCGDRSPNIDSDFLGMVNLGPFVIVA